MNTPTSLSIAAALHPEVSDALDAAQRDAVAEIRSWLGAHSVTRVGPRGRQEVVPVERLGTVAIAHRTSRAGDPHRHIHLQVGTRVWAAGAWRGLDTAALFRQQGAIRALGTAVLAAHPRLAAVLDARGLTLDPVTGEVAELAPFNAVLSKRAEQVARNLAALQARWEAAHPGAEPGRAVRARWQAQAWDHDRPHKKPTHLGSESGWRVELDAAGYTPGLPRAPHPTPRTLDDVRVQEVANRALDRCASAASTWTVHDIQEHVTRLLTQAGVRADRRELRDVIAMTTRLATQDCFSVLPPGTARPAHVAHLTTLRVIDVDTRLRDLQAARAAPPPAGTPDVLALARDRGLDDEQAQAAAAVASNDPLVVIEGAAGAGKTTMLAVAIHTAGLEGRATRIVTPTKKAADVAARELGVPAESVAKLMHAHGWRCNTDGVWTRLGVGETDPDTGRPYTGPSAAACLRRGERIVVDEAGMLDQDTALALLRLADEAGASLALVGDRAQLPAVGRGGLLDIAAQVCPRTLDMATVHRFTDPQYADLSLRIRRGANPTALFDRLHALGLVALHASTEDAHAAIARSAGVGDAVTVATNHDARALNTTIRRRRVHRGDDDDTRTTPGSDALPIGAGDIIQTRRNAADLRVANRQTWTVQYVTDTGEVWARPTGPGRADRASVRLPAAYVAEHTHLAYAATAYGVQGATTPAAHTLLTDALDASGLYVAMTRGRHTNTLHVVAADLADAREQFTTALQRDRADRGLTDATRAATHAVTGLVDDGPVALVNAERARLLNRIQTAEQEATRRDDVLAALTRQNAEHRTAREQQTQVVTAADAHLARARAVAAAPLVEKATADGADYLATQQRMRQANRATTTAGRFARRAAARTARDAPQPTAPPKTPSDGAGATSRSPRTTSPPWAHAVADQHADARAALWKSIGAGQRPSDLQARAAQWRAHADHARRTLAQIDALPVTDAAQPIHDRSALASAEGIAVEAASRARAADPTPRRPPTPVHQPGPDRGAAPSL